MINHEARTASTLIPSGISKENLLVSTIQNIELPFMQALAREFGATRGWRVCGPASIVLSRVLSNLLDIPIGRKLPGEHLELSVGIYDPRDHPDRQEKMEEQTFLTYMTGTGFTYYIDPIYGLLMQGAGNLEGAIQIEKFSDEAFERSLIMRHNLYPFTPDHPQIEHAGIFRSAKSSEERVSLWEEMVATLHDERATVSGYVMSNGMIIMDRGNLGKLIKQFAPNWKANKDAEKSHQKRFVDALGEYFAQTYPQKQLVEIQPNCIINNERIGNIQPIREPSPVGKRFSDLVDEYRKHNGSGPVPLEVQAKLWREAGL